MSHVKKVEVVASQRLVKIEKMMKLSLVWNCSSNTNSIISYRSSSYKRDFDFILPSKNKIDGTVIFIIYMEVV